VNVTEISIVIANPAGVVGICDIGSYEADGAEVTSGLAAAQWTTRK